MDGDWVILHRGCRELPGFRIYASKSGPPALRAPDSMRFTKAKPCRRYHNKTMKLDLVIREGSSVTESFAHRRGYILSFFMCVPVNRWNGRVVRTVGAD